MFPPTVELCPVLRMLVYMVRHLPKWRVVQASLGFPCGDILRLQAGTAQLLPKANSCAVPVLGPRSSRRAFLTAPGWGGWQRAAGEGRPGICDFQGLPRIQVPNWDGRQWEIWGTL